MVLDEDLRVIYEQDFPERLYYPNGIFITEDGVHIPKTHPEYMVKNGIEDRLDYEVFRFEGN